MAERVFLASGYGATKMQDVATEAGASKETIYRHFGSKEGLFAEVVSNRARGLRRDLVTEVDDPKSVDRVLRDFGTNLLRALTSPEVASFFRMVVAETARDPALGHLFYSLGPGRTIAELANYLTAARAKGLFLGTDPGLAASLFVGAVVADAQMRCLLLHEGPRPNAAEIEDRIREITRIFAATYLPRDGDLP